MFQYDQLNRINTAFAISNYINPTNDWSLIPPASITQFAEGFSYDQNGNILTAHRNTSTPGASATLDDLQYHYYTAGGAIYIPSATSPADATNKLAYVTDNVVSANTDDIETQPINNYTYDGIGNLTSDKYENISNISWTTYGKIKQITYLPVANKPNILFKYDAAGNRISKELIYATGSRNTTYYVRDAQGNVMATYYKDVRVAGSNTITILNLNELHLYGSSRLGIFNANNQMHLDINGSSVLVNGFTQINSRTLGTKTYELSNHLGNVLTVVTDRKIPIDNNTDGVTDYYLSDIINTTDYYAFGSPMPGRQFNAGNYRYGFNGKENDHETVSTGEGTQDYGDRIYNPALGRFLSVDPLTKSFPMLTPYQFASNRPIDGIDLDGREFIHYTVTNIQDGKVTGIQKVDMTHSTWVHAAFNRIFGINFEAFKVYTLNYKGASYMFTRHNDMFTDVKNLDPQKTPTYEGLQALFNVTDATGGLMAGAMANSLSKMGSVRTTPQGMSEESFSEMSGIVRNNLGGVSDDIVVQGSRANGTASVDSDIDIAIKVDESKFNTLVEESFGTPNAGSAKERTMNHAIETGKIQAGEAGLSGLRKGLESKYGMKVDISIVKKGGKFDNGAQIPLKK